MVVSREGTEAKEHNLYPFCSLLTVEGQSYDALNAFLGTMSAPQCDYKLKLSLDLALKHNGMAEGAF